MPDTESSTKQTNKERIKEIVAGIEDGIQKLFQSEKYFDYLRTMSRFHSYSVNNTVLIHLQMPDASAVAGFNQWKNRFGRHVKKGAKGLTIIAPTPFKKKVEEMKLDPDTDAPMYDEDGKLIMEERMIEIPMFKPVKVFDVSQTEGKPLPQLSADLAGDVRQYEAFMEALRRASPVPIEFRAIKESMDGYFSSDEQKIILRTGMSQVQTVCAAVHEIGHSMLHNREQAALTAAAGTDKEPPKQKDRNTEEVEAESLAFSVCAYYGIETGSFGYIASWSKDKTLPELRASLETITKTANTLIISIDKHFAEICKERGITLSERTEQPPQEQPVEAAPTQAADAVSTDQQTLLLLDGEQYLHVQTTDEGYDYSLYDAETMRLTDGGQFPEESIRCHATNDPMEAAYREVCVREGLDPAKKEAVPLDMLETIAEANAIKEQPDTTLDEYPLPDDSMRENELEDYGYTDGDMLPLSMDMAKEFLENDNSIYTIVDGGQAELCFDVEEIEARPIDAMFSVPREEWEQSKTFKDAVDGRMNFQEEREQAFLNHAADCFAIYQVKQSPDFCLVRFESLESLQKQGQKPEKDNYDLVYTGPLPEGATLDSLYEKFNIDHPADYRHPSMSVSDIVAIKRDGVLSYHYCDSIGFKELPNFNQNQPENYLKNAELAMEDDANMIDGIINNGPKQPTVAELEAQVKAGQTISLLDLANAVQTERKEPVKRRSVLARLNKPLPEQPKKQKSAPKRGAERDR